MTRIIDMASLRYGRLIVVSRSANQGTRATWLCRCDCGQSVVVTGRDLRVGSTASCGCLAIDVTRSRATTHGHTASKVVSPEYRVWSSMLSRCKDHPNYAGRGIKVCDRWLIFENFLADMGPRPVSPRHTIERENNDGDYEKKNCSWQTYAVQQRNKRTNVTVEFRGERMNLCDAAQLAGISYQVAWYRIKAGWPVSEALSAALYRRAA